MKVLKEKPKGRNLKFNRDTEEIIDK